MKEGETHNFVIVVEIDYKVIGDIFPIVSRPLIPEVQDIGFFEALDQQLLDAPIVSIPFGGRNEQVLAHCPLSPRATCEFP